MKNHKYFYYDLNVCGFSSSALTHCRVRDVRVCIYIPCEYIGIGIARSEYGSGKVLMMPRTEFAFGIFIFQLFFRLLFAFIFKLNIFFC